KKVQDLIQLGTPARGLYPIAEQAPYVGSYNPERKNPNWVMWQTLPERKGTYGERDPRLFRPPMAFHFLESPGRPDAIPTQDPNAYPHSGYDRGHLAPNGDFPLILNQKDTVAQSASTFLLGLNVAPQAPNNNRGPWNHLEMIARFLADHGKKVYNVVGFA